MIVFMIADIKLQHFLLWTYSRVERLPAFYLLTAEKGLPPAFSIAFWLPKQVCSC